ncbi:MAG: SDR family oxidoreductase [Candidatus Hydrogenedentota bacterium]
MAKRLLITGAGGFVAGSIIAQADDHWAVHAVSRGKAPIERANLTWHSIDPLDRGALAAAADKAEPDAIIHAGAIAGIDYCKAHPEEAARVNTEWTAHVAEIAATHAAKLVYCSTDNVFDGEEGFYDEAAPPNPVNVYGQTKVAGEEAVTATPIPWVVARISIVMGLPMLGDGNSFLSRMLPALEKGEPLGVPADEIRSPIDVVTLGRALLELADNDFTGIIHLASNDVLDRCELVRRIAARLGYDPDLVQPNDPATIPGRDTRPRDASLDNRRARRTLDTPMVGVEQAAGLIIAHR